MYPEEILGRPLPCQQYDGQERPYVAKRAFDRDERDFLSKHVLIYHHIHYANKYGKLI